jgi:hypothetical protein
MLTLAAWGVFLWWAPLMVIVAVPVIALLAAGVKIPEWRLAIVVILWAAFVLSCICIPLPSWPGHPGAVHAPRPGRERRCRADRAHVLGISRGDPRLRRDDITVAIVEPEARAMLLDFDRTTTHRSVVADARS